MPQQAIQNLGEIPGTAPAGAGSKRFVPAAPFDAGLPIKDAAAGLRRRPRHRRQLRRQRNPAPLPGAEATRAAKKPKRGSSRKNRVAHSGIGSLNTERLGLLPPPLAGRDGLGGDAPMRHLATRWHVRSPLARESTLQALIPSGFAGISCMSSKSILAIPRRRSGARDLPFLTFLDSAMADKAWPLQFHRGRSFRAIQGTGNGTLDSRLKSVLSAHGTAFARTAALSGRRRGAFFLRTWPQPRTPAGAPADDLAFPDLRLGFTMSSSPSMRSSGAASSSQPVCPKSSARRANGGRSSADAGLRRSSGAPRAPLAGIFRSMAGPAILRARNMSGRFAK